MTDWGDLDRELGAWDEAGRTATFWWRDDDAVTATPALRRLLALASSGEPVPLALAVVPMAADATLASALADADRVVALQHGYLHANQAPAGMKKAEYPDGRDPSAALQELRAGFRRLCELCHDHVVPALVPPWNRIDPALIVDLADVGIRGLSTYGPRRTQTTGRGIHVVNTHIDIVDWRARRFLGVEACLDRAIGHLAARRAGCADAGEPTGLLTHHLVHDEEAWSFLTTFLQRTNGHAAARWTNARDLFGPDGPT